MATIKKLGELVLKMWLYVLSSVLLAVLLGCSNDKEATKETNNDSKKTEVRKKEEKPKSWNQLSDEEKEEMVVLEMDKHNLGQLPTAKIIERIDYLYQNTGYTMSEIPAAFDEAFTYLSTMKEVEGVEIFGNSSFTDLEIDFPTIDLIKEEGNKVSVVFSKGDLVYLSVAQDGEWIKKDVSLFGSGDLFLKNLYITDDYLYVISEDLLKPAEGKKYKYDENGLSQGETFNKRITEVVRTNHGDGLILETDQKKQYEFMPSHQPESLVKFEDKHGLMDLETHVDGHYFVDVENKKIYYGEQHLYQFDMAISEPLYDVNGQDKSVLFDDYADCYLNSYGTSQIAAVCAMGYDHELTVKISTFDKNLDHFKEELDIFSLMIDRKSDYIEPTFTDTEIHLWDIDQFERKHVLKLARIEKGMDGITAESKEDSTTASSSKTTTSTITISQPDSSSTNTVKAEYVAKLKETEKKERNNEYQNDGQMTQDFGFNFELWDALLNEVYQVLKTQLSNSEMNQLKQEQLSWIQIKDKKAQEEYDKSGGGTLSSMVRAETLFKLTKERTKLLVNQYMK
jgi:uncharacterized protein YecT (DUF1311 family)